MNLAGFVLLALILAAYVVLDGFDLGVGILHLFALRNAQEREASFRIIGPYWSGNEVLLVASGALLFALFPRAYAAAFSGFYLPFIIVLWLLMMRGMSIELRGHLPDGLWRSFWDVMFGISSALLAVVLGLAIGNLVRGLPLDAAGFFTGTFSLLLNGYALGVAVLALLALAMHGTAYASWRLTDDLQVRALRAGRFLWWFVAAFFLLVTAQTIIARFGGGAAAWFCAAVAAAALLAMRFVRGGIVSFALSSVFVAALIGTAAATLFPYLLPSSSVREAGISIYNAGGNANSLGTAVAAGAIGVGAAAVYGTLAAVRMLRTERRPRFDNDHGLRR